LSFNVIKNSRVIKQGNREINTQLRTDEVDISVSGNQGVKSSTMQSYENIASNILENARLQGEKIIAKAFVDAAQAKTEAFKEGLAQGHVEGYENGHNEATSAGVKETDALRAQADSILTLAKSEYNEYLTEKENHIKDLIVSIAESILKREVKEPDALNEMIFNTLKNERNIKFFIIKSNNMHFDMLKTQVEIWKGKLAFQGDIFVIEDNFLDDGTAVIEKETGKSIVSISYGMEKIKEVLREEQIQM